MKYSTVKAVDTAITIALARCQQHGLIKPMDIAASIRVELDRAGLKIVRKPTGKLDLVTLDRQDKDGQ